jgi:8-oxo-dGTP pyrophosphatase MutT (NUDIX family)
VREGTSTRHRVSLLIAARASPEHPGRRGRHALPIQRPGYNRPMPYGDSPDVPAAPPATDAPAAPSAAPSPRAGRRVAAVLVPIYDGPQGPTVIFIRRTTGINHPGQVAFPGGRPEPGDADLAATALRETYEELAIPPSLVRIVGVLPTVETLTSNYAITPFVGRLATRPVLRPQQREVDAVLDVPLAALLAPGLPLEADWELPLPGERLPPGVRIKPGQVRRVRYFPWGEDNIWGATARMVEELLAAIRGGSLTL